ncbi:MAG: SDR family NAD(P)-dependent oxidoreductase [Pseudomonadales bacterium]
MTWNPQPFKDRVVLITGAGRGIGQAAAKKFAAAGASLFLCDVDAESLAETQALLGAATEVGVIARDLTQLDAPQAIVQAALSQFERIDVVVNNAGYIWNGAMHRHSEAQWQAMLDIHATVPFRLLQAFANWMIPTARAELEASGAATPRKVVNISSVSGTQGSATQVAYATGKAAVVGLTKTLAKEWGRYNVQVNAVAFGHIETRLTQAFETSPPSIEHAGQAYKVGLSNQQIEHLRRTVPLGRPGHVDEAAGAILLMALPEANYITGEVLTCSGGA